MANTSFIVKLDSAGNFLALDISVTLEEYVPATTTVSDKNGNTSATGTKEGAMAATPSSTEKESKKDNHIKIGGAAMLTSGNGNKNVCVQNLLAIIRGEVPYDRLRGLDAKVVDRPVTDAADEIQQDACSMDAQDI